MSSLPPSSLPMSSPAGVLDGVALFESFTPDERDAVAARGRLLQLPAGTVLMREGDDADALYVLLEGTVRVVRADAVGNLVEVGFRLTGECFGEMALIDGGLRSATVIAATKVRVFELERESFMEVMAQAPSLMTKLLRELSRKIRDVSERVVREDLERRTRAAEAELARHRAITQAVTGLAHEMNTPLGICVTAASHVQELAESRAPSLKDSAALLVSNLDRAVRLVQAFTAIAACHHAEPLETLDIQGVTEQAAALFAMERPDAPILIRTTVDGPCPWVGYRTHLERALCQLFSNAAAHAYPKGTFPEGAGGNLVEVEIEPDALDGKPAWRLTIRDRGVGIPEDALPKLTDAFYTTARGRGHKGLGLTIAFNTVTGPLGGRMQVDSAPGVGTTVILTVPQEL
ncbi:sensor histidine kinase [Azospirillum sp. sgz302134]